MNLLNISKILLAVVLLLGTTSKLIALQIGQIAPQLLLKNNANHNTEIPFLGKKVIVIFYTDPDESDFNESFRDLLKSENISKEKYIPIGIANMKDAPWKPNSLIRLMIRNKINKFHSIILNDDNHKLKNKWNLGDCNNKDICIIIGIDKKIKYIYKDKMDSNESKKAINIIKELINK